jgi:hypothetical protein
MEKKIKDISIDDVMNCKDKVYAKDIYYRFCMNKNCECVWSQYETAYFLPYFDELKKNEKAIRENFLEYKRNPQKYFEK